MNDVKVLVLELVAVDTLSTSSIKVGKVSALYNIFIYIYIYVSPKMRTVPVRELGSQFAN